ncbi:acetyltransferase, GNAT family family [Paecilomyces variotii No. 5]|uniref:Acetyltransferase, GNAT family family n=1 Tax=Byssochlamys spectabilis (strain No. 5 / NBRC 109023) TaxID=1356009 RepID=V5HZ50_BYSSN|nr:acetyltransferase, GNAT family family [Paecilomyces variotii No. 5]
MGPFPKYLEPYERPEAERPEGHLNFVWSSEARGREVSDYITYFAFKPARKKLPNDPDTFLWGGGGLDSGHIWFWRTYTILEAQKKDGYPIRPHITMTAIVDRVGQDNSIFYEELMPLLHAMQQRANQPKIPPEEWESASDLWDEKYNGPYVFEDEKIFPVLMLSFLGPQHARVFYARMKDGEVIIGQSKLYSFEKKDDANIELFARLLLSTPIGKLMIWLLPAARQKDALDILARIARVEKKTFPSSEAWDFGADLWRKKPNTRVLYATNAPPSSGSKEPPILIAYALYVRQKGTALLHKVCVAEPYRGQGVGHKLMNYIKERLRREGCQSIQLWVDKARAPARALYARSGFQEREVIGDYYAPDRAGIRMVLDLERG